MNLTATNKTAMSKMKTGSLSMKRATSALALLLAWGLPALAHAQDADEPEKTDVEKRQGSGLGLAPGIPQVSAIAGGFSPAYAPGSEDAQAWHADFHGFLSMPLNIGLNKRAGAVTEDQYSTVMHAPPVVPEYRDAFTYTSAIPEPYVQLNFGYGNAEVQANVIVQARSASTGASYFDASTSGGISDAYLTFTPQSLPKAVGILAHVGAFTNRYGIAGEYDAGKYGTPLFAQVNGVGENIVAYLDAGDFDFELQQGFQAQLDKAPLGIVPGDWNRYADSAQGTSMTSHFHAGVTYKNLVTVGGHYMNVWTADDRANMGTIPDGKINLIGGDLRATLGRWGHFYFGVTSADAQDSRSVGRVVEILNATGGPGLMRSYLGPDSNGTGKLFIMGGQYDMSLARMIYGNLFYGQSPDVRLSLFGQRVHVTSDDADYDNVTKQKFGAELGYSMFKHMATSFRFDSIAQDLTDVDESETVISPRLIFRTGWQSRDQVMLQYSHYFMGDEVYVRDGTPAEINENINPDEDVISLSATMWW